MKWKHYGIDTENHIVHEIAQELGVDPVVVRKTIRAFFSYKGIYRFVKSGHPVSIKNLGIISPGRRYNIIRKRKERTKKVTERLKKNRYNRKKTCKFVQI